MKEIKLEHVHQIQHFFGLFPITNLKLENAYNNLLQICDEKDQASSKENYEEAANLRQEELKAFRKIIDILNSKGILKNNVLKIHFLKP